MEIQKTKIIFDLEGTGWPMASESVWAIGAGNHYQLLNSPFYAYGYSLGDIVEVTKNDSGQLIVKKSIKRSGHSTYRLFVSDTTGEGAFQEYWAPIGQLGCTHERATKSLLTVDVPVGVDVSTVYKLLEEGENSKVWSFEEGHYFDSN